LAGAQTIKPKRHQQPGFQEIRKDLLPESPNLWRKRLYFASLQPRKYLLNWRQWSYGAERRKRVPERAVYYFILSGRKFREVSV